MVTTSSYEYLEENKLITWPDDIEPNCRDIYGEEYSIWNMDDETCKSIITKHNRQQKLIQLGI